MSLCYRERRQLRGIQAALVRSDPHLAAMLDVFGRLYDGQDMPASEQARSRKNRDRRAVTQIAAAFAAAALALSVVFSAALAAQSRCGAPAPGHRPGQAATSAACRTSPARTASRPVGGPGG